MVDGMELGLATGPIEGAGIPDPLARQPTLIGCRRTHRHHGAAGVPAEHTPLVGPGELAAAHLQIDRVDGNRLHAHQQVIAQRLRIRQHQIQQVTGLAEGSGPLVSNGFHTVQPGSNRCSSRWCSPL